MVPLRAPCFLPTLALLAALSPAGLRAASEAGTAPPGGPQTSAPQEGSRLPLGEALARALEREPSFQVDRLQVPIAEIARDQQRTTWDPVLSGSATLSDDDAVASTGLDGAVVRKSDTRRASMSLVKPLEKGGQVSLTANDSRALTNSSFALLNPAYRSGVQVRLERPLARGYGRDANSRMLRRADLSLERTRHELRSKVLDLISRTERAYWNLASAQEKRDVAQISLDAARQTLDWNRSRVEAGALARIAVIEAEAAVSQREAALLNAELALENARVSLLELVDPPVRPSSQLPPLGSAPGEALPDHPEHDAVLAAALASHPSYQQALLDLRTSEIEVAFARDQVLPKIDLVASMEVNGLGSNRGNSLDQAISSDFQSYFVGLSWEVPLGRRNARRELKRRRLLVEQALRQVKNIETQLENSVEGALRRYAVNLRSQAVALKSLEAARIKLEAEQDRYKEGMITADDLLRFQRELAEAHANEVTARTQTSISAMEIWTAAGTLPERRGVALTALEY